MDLPGVDQVGALALCLTDDRPRIFGQKLVSVQDQPPRVSCQLRVMPIVNACAQIIAVRKSGLLEGNDLRIILRQLPDDVPAAIRAAVVDHENVVTVPGRVHQRFGDDVILVFHEADRGECHDAP
jgi:hypothetical protein